MEDSDTLIAKHRLAALWNAIFGTYSRNLSTTMMSQFRMRNRTMWSTEQNDNAQQYFQSQNATYIKNYIQDDLIYQDMYKKHDDLTHRQLDQCKKDHRYAQELAHTLNNLFPQSDPPQMQHPSNTNAPPTKLEMVHEIRKRIRSIHHYAQIDRTKQQKPGSNSIEQYTPL